MIKWCLRELLDLVLGGDILFILAVGLQKVFSAVLDLSTNLHIRSKELGEKCRILIYAHGLGHDTLHCTGERTRL